MKYCLLLPFFLLMGQISFANNNQEVRSDFTAQRFEASEGRFLNYRELSPLPNSKGKKFPLVLFLHGAGERGDDNLKQIGYIDELFSGKDNRSKYPCYVIAPQCPENEFWPFAEFPNKEGRWDRITYPFNPVISNPLKMVEELIAAYFKKYSDIDKGRVYVIGLSMGGMGTFDIVVRNPNLFAAAIPICGGVNVDRLKACNKKTSFRVYHGGVDKVVPVETSRSAVKKLQELKIPVEYIEFPEVDHNSWTPAFNSPDFMSWLFKQKR